MLAATQIIWEHLTASGTGLYSLVRKRVWSPEAPRVKTRWLNDAAAVIYEVPVEDPHSRANVLTCRVAFSCYGGTANHAEADAVYRALYDRLHGTRGALCASGLIMEAVQESGQPGLREPETEWPFAAATYKITVQSVD